MDRNTILSLIHEDIQKVQNLFEEYISSNVSIVNNIGKYIGSNSGKKLRPAVLVLTAKMFGPPPDSVYHLGALVEILHTATLVHDDIIDEADTRRGRPSVNASYGNEMSVLMGDWLYMTSFEIAIAQRNFKILDVLLEITKRMVEGELIQLDLLGKIDLTVEEHLDIARRKTAYLFSACTRLGGIVGNCSQEQFEALYQIGLNLGLAFQLVDDVLDFTADKSTLGKPIMNDLREGKVTLPVIYLLETGNPQYRKMVEAVFKEKNFKSVKTSEFLDALKKHDCIERAMAFAHSFAKSAKVMMDGFPDNIYRKALIGIADYILDRSY